MTLNQDSDPVEEHTTFISPLRMLGWWAQGEWVATVSEDRSFQNFDVKD